MPFNNQEEIIVHLSDHLCAKLVKLCDKLIMQYPLESNASSLATYKISYSVIQEKYYQKVATIEKLRSCLKERNISSFWRLRNFLTKMRMVARTKLFRQEFDKHWDAFVGAVNKAIRRDIVDYGHELLLMLSKKYRKNMQNIILENFKMMEFCSAYPECVKAGQQANQKIMDKIDYLQTLAGLLRKEPADLREQLIEYRKKIRSPETKQILRVSHNKIAEQVRQYSLGVVTAIEKIVALPV